MDHRCMNGFHWPVADPSGLLQRAREVFPLLSSSAASRRLFAASDLLHAVSR